MFGTQHSFQIAAMTLGLGNGRFHIILACIHEVSVTRLTLVPVRTFQKLCLKATVDFN